MSHQGHTLSLGRAVRWTKARRGPALSPPRAQSSVSKMRLPRERYLCTWAAISSTGVLGPLFQRGGEGAEVKNRQLFSGVIWEKDRGRKHLSIKAGGLASLRVLPWKRRQAAVPGPGLAPQLCPHGGEVCRQLQCPLFGAPFCSNRTRVTRILAIHFSLPSVSNVSLLWPYYEYRHH